MQHTPAEPPHLLLCATRILRLPAQQHLHVTLASEPLRTRAAPGPMTLPADFSGVGVHVTNLQDGGED